MEGVILIFLLAILVWNVKQGFERIDERLKEIYEIIVNNNK
jgi:hypothetical protein